MPASGPGLDRRSIWTTLPPRLIHGAFYARFARAIRATEKRALCLDAMLDRLIRITIPYNASTRIRQCYETSKHRSNRYLTERSQIFDEQIAHFQRRASMPPNLVKRVPILTREVLAGRYWLYSKGGVSILRDLFFVRKF